MAAGNMCKADTAYYKINSLVHGHDIYKSVWLPVIGEKLYLEPGNLHNNIAVAY